MKKNLMTILAVGFAVSFAAGCPVPPDYPPPASCSADGRCNSQCAEGPDLDRIRHLTSECFRRAEGGQDTAAVNPGNTHETPAPQPVSAAMAESVTH